MDTRTPHAATDGRTPAERGRLLKAGKLSQANFPRRLGVSCAAVSQWLAQLAADVVLETAIECPV